jgi:DNA-3-methyladenine glycosylase II
MTRYWKRAVAELSRRDPVLRDLMAAYPGIHLRSRGDAFQTLARSITAQQISVKAADAVWTKLQLRVPELTPLAIAACAEDELRQCGLSLRKAQYLIDLATKFSSGQLAEAAWSELDDEALIDELTKVKGIGRWTAEMFLLFYLNRPDVFPIDDIGLQRAMSMAYNKGRELSKSKMVAIANEWQPWRSVATWYLWRSIEPLPVEY